ncbi:uncharacterized protein LOC122037405 [Zingiber officinale]|uniref:Uncharacterized protein n=1 Tax=Zingiber officinale TaxID=94328 RepID=A0A8J5KFV2_ZINOF|nr:uncharacterized protein LOC122037405 [Zingiber officinale]KAG6467050.1 hypothetical protein ZIOFF_075150 [Zingiber officinale]KAG6488400.1 hypothetical protein ZIOFF_049643 [Zingiber officinale]
MFNDANDAMIKKPPLGPSESLLIRRRGKAVPAPLDLAPVVGAQEREYTSLRDVIVGGPPQSASVLASPVATPGAGEIRMKNRLVQQAAQAYLQPTPTAASQRPRRGLLLSSDGESCGEHLRHCLRFFAGICRSVWQFFCPFESSRFLLIHIRC